jgi:hypothetical protein
MAPWLKDRLEIIRLTSLRPSALWAWAGLQALELILRWVPVLHRNPILARASGLLPWYGWALGWLAALWLASIEHSLERKRRFDETSLNFFRAFLDFLIHQGSLLFGDADRGDFHLKIKDWQQQAVEGIAIGLGPEASLRFFEKMEAQHPLMEAYRKSRSLRNNEPLCLILQGNIDALIALRAEQALDPEKWQAPALQVESGGGPRQEKKPPERNEKAGLLPPGAGEP